ncbi:MAG: hypothetical protein ACHP6H_03350 [Legionellales bacterium]
MFLAENTIREMLAVVSRYNRVSYAPALIEQINHSAEIETLGLFHESILQFIEKNKPPKGVFFMMPNSNYKRHLALKNAVLLLIELQNKNEIKEQIHLFKHQINPVTTTVQPSESCFHITEPKAFSTQEKFNRDLFYQHVINSDMLEKEPDDTQTMLNNALVRLIDSYSNHLTHYASYKSKSYDLPEDDDERPGNERVKKRFYSTRLAVLNEWTTPEGYAFLAKAIITTKKMSDENKIAIPRIFEEDGKINEAIHLLNWLAIIYELFEASESPYAMSQALGIILRFTNPFGETDNEQEIKRKKQTLIHEIDLYRSFYIGSDSCVEVNIRSETRLLFTENLIKLHSAKESPGTQRFTQVLSQVRTNLLVIYNELALLSFDLPSALNEFLRLQSEAQGKEDELFKHYFYETLSSIIKLKDANANRTTNLPYEPLKPYADKLFFFTPNSWSDVSGDSKSESIRLSNRSSESSSSRSQSSSGKHSSKQGLEGSPGLTSSRRSTPDRLALLTSSIRRSSSSSSRLVVTSDTTLSTPDDISGVSRLK